MEVRHFGSFADLIKALRRQHRLSQRALAKALRVSPGYVGQWELQLSQPSPEVTVKLCRTFAIDDTEYVQRLAYACRAPEWLRESIIRYSKGEAREPPLSPEERRVIETLRRVPADKRAHLLQRIEGWVEGVTDAKEHDDGGAGKR